MAPPFPSDKKPASDGPQGSKGAAFHAGEEGFALAPPIFTDNRPETLLQRKLIQGMQQPELGLEVVQQKAVNGALSIAGGVSGVIQMGKGDYDPKLDVAFEESSVSVGPKKTRNPFKRVAGYIAKKRGEKRKQRSAEVARDPKLKDQDEESQIDQMVSNTLSTDSHDDVAEGLDSVADPISFLNDVSYAELLKISEVGDRPELTGDIAELLGVESGTRLEQSNQTNDRAESFGEKFFDRNADLEDAFSVIYNFTGTYVGILGMASSIATLSKSDAEIEEKVLAFFDLLSNTSGTISGLTGLITDFSAEGSNHSDNAGVASNATFGAEGIIKGLKEIVLFFKEVAELIHQNNEAKRIGSPDVQLSGTEKFEAAMSMGQHILNLAGPVIQTIRAIQGLMDTTFAGLTTAVPAVGMALSAIDIGVRVYDLIKAHQARADMKERKGIVREGISDMFPLIEKRKVVNSEQDQRAFINYKHRVENEHDEAQKEKLDEYDFALEMEYINNKRITRASLHIAKDCANIIGDGLTLGGLSAVAGIPIKAASAAFGIGMSIVRKIKQHARDKAAEKIASGEITSSKFDTTKSSAEKTKQIKKNVKFIYKQLGGLGKLANQLDPSDLEQNHENSALILDNKKRLTTKVDIVNAYISATGAHPSLLLRKFHGEDSKESGFNEATKYLVAKMKERE